MRRISWAFVLVLLSAVPASAQRVDRDWTGLGNGSWNSLGNFSPFTGSVNDLGFMSFNNNATGTITTTLDANKTITALVVANNVATAGTISIASGAGTNTLTIDLQQSGGLLVPAGIGINMSAANRDLTISAGLRAAVNPQSWLVAAGRTLTLSGGVGTTSALTLTVNNGANAGQVFLGGTGAFASGSTLVAQNGLLRLDTTTALNGMSLTAGGVSVNPLATTQLGLNATGTYTYSTPLALASSSGTVRSQVNLLQPATAIWGGAVSVAGTGTTGVIELNTQAGGNLIFANPMTGTGYGGAVQLGGASGAGALNGAVTLAATNSRIVKVGGSVWSLGAANAGNAWSATQIQAGVLVTTLDSALASSASLTLGTTGTATVGTLDLYNSSQSVSGLTTATDDSLVNPADNRVGLGDGVGPGAAGTLTYAGTTTSFAGSLVDNVGVVAGKQLSLTVSGGGLTLQSANTYSGATLVTGGTLALGSRSGGAGGGFTNFGSFASSPTVTVRSGANLNVTGATGGLNSLGGQFAPVANQVLRGEGAVTGATTIQPAATIRGGEPGVSPNGQLTVVGPLAIQGGTVGSAGGQWVVDLNGTTVSNSLVGRLAVTGGNTLNFDVTGGPVTIRLEGIGNLPFNQPYTFDVATAGGFARNGTSGVTSYTYGPGNDFVLDDDSAFLTGYVGIPTLTVNSGTLTLGFTPVPEPGTVLAVAAVGLGAVRLRRRILAG